MLSREVLSWTVPFLERSGIPEWLWHTLIRKLAHNDEYNKAADNFNEQTADFPAKLLRRGEAVVFR